MKLVEIFKEQDELNGMRIIHYHLYGNFINPVKFLMDPIGIIGELNKKLLGKKTLNYG